MDNNLTTADLKMAHLAAIVSSSDDAIISKSLDGIITSWNDGAQTMFGYTAEQAIGQSISMLIPAERLHEEEDILRRIRQGQRIRHFETERITRDNRRLQLSITISPIIDADGRIIGASKIARDVTRQRANERKAQETELLFRMAVASTHFGTIDHHFSNDLYTYTQEYCKLFGLPYQPGHPPSVFRALMLTEDRTLVDKSLTQAMRSPTENTLDMRYRIRRADNQQLCWIRETGKIHFDDNGQAIRYMGLAIDVTSEMMRQEQLEHLVAERTATLQKAKQELERYAYVTSHDLQESLRKVQIFCDMLRSEPKDENASNALFEKITRSVRKMKALITDVLRYLNAGQRDGEHVEPLNVRELVEEVVRDFSAVIRQKNATIILPAPILIRGDRSAVKELISHLLDNALKFSSKAPVVTISANAAIRGNGPAKRMAELVFADNGIGFHESDREEIFLPFKKLHPPGKYEGNGVGLAIARKIVESLRGNIHANGINGKGAAFVVTLEMD